MDVLTLSTHSLDGCTVVELHGELDLSCSGYLREQLLDVLTRQAPHLVVDLSDLTFIDSTGLTVLLATERRVRLLGGSFALVAPQRIVAKVLRITGFDTHFAIFDTAADAARASGRAKPGT